MFGCEDGGQIEKFADHPQKLAFSFSPRKSISRFGGMPAEFNREIAKAIGENYGIRRFSHRSNMYVLYDTG